MGITTDKVTPLPDPFEKPIDNNQMLVVKTAPSNVGSVHCTADANVRFIVLDLEDRTDPLEIQVITKGKTVPIRMTIISRDDG